MDLRVVKTRKAIHDAFLQLIQTRGYDKMTIQDIAETAMINRNTFYLHYTDKYDLMERIWQEYFQKLNFCLEEFGSHPPILDRPLFTRVLKSILGAIHENMNFFYIMATHNTQTQFTEKLKQSFYTFNLNQRNGEEMSQNSQIRFEYMVSGIVGVVMLWILDYQSIEVDDVIQQLVEIHFESRIRIG